MSLFATRKRRKNAGSKMSSLLDAEEKVDHFYDNIYGGFEEELNDIDYDSGETDSEDSIDSDFSIDENDEHISDDQNDEELKQKPKTKLKFGFSPKPKKTNVRQIKLKRSPRNTTEERVALEVDVPSMETIVSESISSCFGRSIFTETIIENRLKFGPEVTQFDRNNNFKLKSRAKESAKQLTQKELLEEAVITEKINLKSLKEWQKSESERTQKIKVAKRAIKGPFIRYHSVSMPLIQEMETNSTDETTCDQNVKESHNSGAKSYSRTFMSFSDDQTYDSLLKSLSSGRTKPSKDVICAVTQMPARYYDPVSGLPFANSQAFNAIRHQYYNNLEIYGNMDNEEVKQWTDWRLNISQKWKEWHQNHSSNDKTDLSESNVESQVIQSEPLLPKVAPIRSVSRLGRKKTTKRKKY